MKTKRKLNINKYELFEKPVNNFQYSSSKLFLVCSDSFWHNGIHLTLNGDAIKNIYEGTIIACRFSSGFKTKDIDFDKFKINPEMLESFNVSAGNFFIYNYFELKDGNYQLKEEFKSENDENKIIQELIKKELGRGYSNSFVLIEHTAEKSIIEKNSSNPSKIKYQFYTLFNHLRPLNYYTNKEKSDLFLYSAELEFTRTVPYNYVKGYYVLDNLRQKRQEIIKIPSETKVSEIDYYEYTLNKETKYAYIDESMVRKFTSHSETRRPAFTNSEKKDPEYLKPGNYRTVPNEMFLFDNIKKSKRCVKGIITKKDNIEINYEAFITYLKNSSEDIGLEISSLNGFIYFSKSIKDTLKACLVEYNSWDIKSNPKPNITYNIKNGFLLTGRHTPSGQKEYYYLSQNKNIYIPDVECHYIQAKKLKSNSEYAVEDIYIPCELKIKETESSSTAFKKVEYYLNGSRQKCYISYDSFRKFTSHLETKRKLRPYESAEANSSSAYLPRTSHDVIDEILIFDTNDISKRLVKASVPKTTKFQISKPELEKLIKNLSDESSDNKKNKFEEGIFVNYDTGSSKGSGYIYLPWGYDLPNIDDNQVAKNLETVKNNVKSISEKLDEWLTKLHQKEEISFKEFKLKLKKDERISEDQIYSYNGTGESIKLEKGDVLGFGGYAAESPVENEDLYKIPDYIHFETFCVNTDFMSFNKNRIDYTADFKIKNEVSVHKQNPTTKTIIKHLPALQFSYNLRKSFFQNMFIKPSFITSPELMNESLQLMYFKKGKEVSLIESETFVELEICGSLKELADNEYIHRDQFDAAYSKPIYTLNNTQELSIYIDEGKSVKESDNKITLYKNYRYEYNGEKSGTRYRKIKYIYLPAENHVKFFITKDLFTNNLKSFEIEKGTNYFLLCEGKTIKQAEIFEEPTKRMWNTPAEKLSDGIYKNAHKEFTDSSNETWLLGKKENSESFIWINKNDIDDKIDTDKPVEEIIYDKWEDFFEEIKLSDFGKYRCEDTDKLLSELSIQKNDEEELKYILNQNQDIVSSLFFNNASEWKQDSGLMDAYKKAWHFCDRDYLQQQRDDYCFWENTSLSSKSNVTFFHPVKFIGLMDKIKIINLHAEELLRVQNRILKMNTLKENGPGIFDKGGYTFCNHAAFLTIRAVDSDYLKFTDNYDAPIDSNYSKYDKTYPYKESSYWCVVLKKQADSKIISELTTCQDIIYYANLGYVVIVAWENPSTDSPHYATVIPGNICRDIKDIKVCNVSTKNRTRILPMSEAFGEDKIKNCHFYVNKKQVFREDYDFSGSRSASITSLESKHGVE